MAGEAADSSGSPVQRRPMAAGLAPALRQRDEQCARKARELHSLAAAVALRLRLPLQPTSQSHRRHL